MNYNMQHELQSAKRGDARVSKMAHHVKACVGGSELEEPALPAPSTEKITQPPYESPVISFVALSPPGSRDNLGESSASRPAQMSQRNLRECGQLATFHVFSMVHVTKVAQTTPDSRHSVLHSVYYERLHLQSNCVVDKCSSLCQIDLQFKTNFHLLQVIANV